MLAQDDSDVNCVNTGIILHVYSAVLYLCSLAVVSESFLLSMRCFNKFHFSVFVYIRIIFFLLIIGGLNHRNAVCHCEILSVKTGKSLRLSKIYFHLIADT